MAKYGGKGGGKLGWEGLGQSTPSSAPKSPKNDGSFERQKLDYKGVGDSTPGCDGESEKITLRK